MSAHGKSISSDTKALLAKLEEFIKSSSITTNKLQSSLKSYQTAELQLLAGHSERLDLQLRHVQEAIQKIQAKDDISNEAVVAIESAVRETHDSFKSGFAEWAEGLRSSCEVMCGEIVAVSAAGFASVSIRNNLITCVY